MKKQNKCVCGAKLVEEHDRMKCMTCGRSIWFAFKLRKPTRKDADVSGGGARHYMDSKSKEGVAW